MNNSDFSVIRWAGGAPWSDAPKSWYILIKQGNTINSWSHGVWFPKSVCHIDTKRGTLRVPNWLLKANKIEEIVTYVKP